MHLVAWWSDHSTLILAVNNSCAARAFVFQSISGASRLISQHRIVDVLQLDHRGFARHAEP